MRQKFQKSSTHLWCLYGFTGIVLMGGVLFENNLGHTLVSLPVNSTLQIYQQNHPTRLPKTARMSPFHLVKAKDTQHLTQSTFSGTSTQNPARNLEKKRIGLAILFLGMVAEKS